MNFGIAVKAFIVDQGKLLVIKRSADLPHKPGQWDIPGGRLNAGEDMFAGLKRETKEETGLNIKALTPIDMHHFVRDDGQQIAMVFFLCAPEGSRGVTLSHEHTDYKWQDLADASELPDWLQSVVIKYKEHNLDKVRGS